MEIDFREIVENRARMRGPEGERWIAHLESNVADVAARWEVQVGELLLGGTESFVFAASGSDGAQLVVKMCVPGDVSAEVTALQLAAGRGYAELIDFDSNANAVLLERLGGKLADEAKPVDEKIGIIVATLRDAWIPLDAPNGLMTGADKARYLIEFIANEANPDCSRAIRETAIRYAREREAAYDPKRSVLVHGDAHMWNTLAIPNGSGYKLVDPDGLFAEPAYDAGISMREWTEELLLGDALTLGRERCALLSDLTGLDPTAIWQWGYVEVVSTGLHCGPVGMAEAADQLFRVAEAWLP